MPFTHTGGHFLIWEAVGVFCFFTLFQVRKKLKGSQLISTSRFSKKNFLRQQKSPRGVDAEGFCKNYPSFGN